MVVNPKTFYNRLLVGTLIVSFLTLGSYSLYSYNKLEDQKAFLVEEKQIVQKELLQIVSRYDILMADNEDIKQQLTISKRRTLRLLDSLNSLEVNLSNLAIYRSQIKALKAERDDLMQLAKDLKAQNLELKQEKKIASIKLIEQENANKVLSEKNEVLAKNLEKAVVLAANSFNAKAYRSKASGKLVQTNKAKRTDAIEVCFTLAENALVEAGEKELYIQILSPNSTVVGDKISKTFEDNTLIYSTKKLVDYTNNVLDICVKARAGDAEKEFVKGTYYVTVFNKADKLGSTEIILN